MLSSIHLPWISSSHSSILMKPGHTQLTRILTFPLRRLDELRNAAFRRSVYRYVSQSHDRCQRSRVDGSAAAALLRRCDSPTGQHVQSVEVHIHDAIKHSLAALNAGSHLLTPAQLTRISMHPSLASTSLTVTSGGQIQRQCDVVFNPLACALSACH